MMHAAKRALVVLVGVVAMAGCAHATVTGSGALSSPGSSAATTPPTGIPSGGSPLPAPAPTPSHHGTSTATPTASHQTSTVTPSAPPPSSAVPPSSAAPLPSKTRRTGAPKLPGNYRVSNFSAASCSWRIVNGAVQVSGLFSIAHTGILSAGDVPYTASDDVTGGYWNGTMQQVFWNSGQYVVTIGSFGYDNYAGKTVTMSVTIQPTGVDDTSSDNSASKVIHVPADATEDGASGQHSFTC